MRAVEYRSVFTLIRKKYLRLVTRQREAEGGDYRLTVIGKPYRIK